MHPISPQVGVVIIHWNQPGLVARAVDSALTSRGISPQVLVVDNGSTDLSREELRGLLGSLPQERIHIVEAGANLGCTGARNLGLAYFFGQAGIDCVFFLDSDAHLDGDCLLRLCAESRSNAKYGLIGPCILDGFDGSAQTVSMARSALDRWGWPASMDRGVPRVTLPVEGAVSTQLVGGAATLVPRRVYESVGGNDDRFFFDVDDSEYSLRVGAAGFQNRLVYDAVVWHEMSSSVRGRRALSRYYNLRNSMLLSRLYLSGITRVRFWLKLVTTVLRDLAASVRYRDGQRFRAVLTAVVDHGRGRYGIAPDWTYQMPPARRVRSVG